MKELIIFIVIFLIIFGFALLVFNGRFIYAQLKYSILGPAPVFSAFEPRTFPTAFDAQRFLRLVIPKIGVDAPIILTNSINENTIQKDLERGAVRYPNSNIILGHSSAYPWYKGDYGSIFSLLNKLEKGDELFIYSGNREYVYQVLEKEIKLPKDLNFENVEDNSIIYLVSCWPINTTWKRIVVKSILTESN